MSDFDLASATKKQLKTYAANTYDGLNLSMNMSEDTMRQRIVDHCKKNNLEMPLSSIQTKHDKANIKKGRKMKYYIVNIPRSEKPGGNEPVPVGVQGVLYTIPRGVDIKVTEAIVEVLRNAVTDNVTQDDDEDAEIRHNEVPTFPFSYRPYIDDEAHAA